MTIMIVDDDTYFLESLGLNLNLRGYVTRLFTNPVLAVDSYRPGGYDLVISDFNMPSMNGLELLKEIKRIDRDAKVILITGDTDIDTIIEALNNQAYAYFLKPIDMEKIVGTLHKAEREFELLHHR